jgi:hypothetical protein
MVRTFLLAPAVPNKDRSGGGVPRLHPSAWLPVGEAGGSQGLASLWVTTSHCAGQHNTNVI